jgi:hypothetical protein
MGIYFISDLLGEFIVGQDVRMGQIVVFLSVLLGMILYYGAELFSKKFP